MGYGRKIFNWIVLSALALALVLELPVRAHAHGEGGDVIVKDIVLEHIGDSYEWHIGKFVGKHVAIPLPVIVCSRENGWKCFSSSHLHGGHSYEGFHIATEGAYAGKVVETLPDGSQVRPWDLSITKTVAGLLINSTIVVLLILGAARHYRKRRITDSAPMGLAGLVEMLVESLVDGIIKPCVGPNYRKFAPYLLTAFTFIFINNIMGIIPIFPAGTNITGNIAATFVLAMATFLVTNLFGTRHYWKEVLWPEVPTWLKVPLPIMPAIEIIGLFTKPFALMIRLFANIMAGHSVILILICIVFVTARMGATVNTSMSIVSILLGIFMNCMELLVAFLQAYVFTMLSSVFIGMAQEGAGHHEKKNDIDNLTTKR
ncbi:MAG: F0F1 ATP synthase subunit A [Bacteroidales bacterium]|nr:F0F1 ATP synthase subunit A [Bacteroidales bacterium]